MDWNQNYKAKVYELAQLLNSINRLKTDLERIEREHMWAWNSYGSELCSGAMTGEEQSYTKLLKTFHGWLCQEYLTPIERLRKKRIERNQEE